MPKKRQTDLPDGIFRDEKAGKYGVRVTYFDATGRRHDLRRLAGDTITSAKDLRKKMLRDLEDHGTKFIDAEKLTFAKLAEKYGEHKLQPPVYKGETKIGGLRSWKNQLVFLKPLVAHFGKMRVRHITHADIERYKRMRAEQPVRYKRIVDGKPVYREKERTIVGVNRELMLLRAILNFAKRNKWIIENPFSYGDPLVSLADEKRRDRILSKDEEKRLLAACVGPRAHLRPLLVVALDTAMRRGELLKLEWPNIDLEARIITVKKQSTKTWEERVIGMTRRVKEELTRLREMAPDNYQGRVFGMTHGVKRSLAKACELAGVENFKLHDCRHSAITRMVQRGMPREEIMKISGHKQIATFLRYLTADHATARRAAAALDEWQLAEERSKADDKPELLN